MSALSVNSNVYINYTSLFSQGGNKTFSALQVAAANYGNGAFQVRQTSALTLDILDISPEGLAKADELKPTKTVENTEAANDVTLETPEISEADRVEMIRINKNAVLARVNEIFAEKGIEVPSGQSFELTTNFLDGSISVAGIDDPELAAAMNEALAGDKELIDRMKKTREELGLTEPANTVPRNFTIEFGSMLETPADAELEYKIDLFVNNPVPLLEAPTDTEATQPTDETPAQLEKPTFYLSILLSNKPKIDPTVSLLDSLDDAKVSNTKKSEKETIDSENSSIKIPDFIPYETEPEESTVAPQESVEELPEFSTFSAFGSYFRANSKVNFDDNGLTLHWNLQLSNWDIAGNTGTPDATQRLFETLNISGSAYYAADPMNSQSLEKQATLLDSLFADGFSQGLTSDWAKNFITQNGLDQFVV